MPPLVCICVHTWLYMSFSISQIVLIRPRIFHISDRKKIASIHLTSFHGINSHIRTKLPFNTSGFRFFPGHYYPESRFIKTPPVSSPKGYGKFSGISLLQEPRIIFHVHSPMFELCTLLLSISHSFFKDPSSILTFISVVSLHFLFLYSHPPSLSLAYFLN